jgi:hypothetical protein
MTAFNAVRFRVKPGREQEFLDAHKGVPTDWPGLQHVNMIKTGDRTYCIIAEWSDMDALANARANMIATLDSFRDTLEDLGAGLGLTDPVSGPVVLALKSRAARTTKAGTKAARIRKPKAGARKEVVTPLKRTSAPKTARTNKRKAASKASTMRRSKGGTRRRQ